MTVFNKQKRHMSNMAADEGNRGRGDGNNRYRGVLTVRDFVSSIAAGPGHRRRSGFWQETTFWGRGSEVGAGVTFCRSTTAMLSHSEAVWRENRRNIKKLDIFEEFVA